MKDLEMGVVVPVEAAFKFSQSRSLDGVATDFMELDTSAGMFAVRMVFELGEGIRSIGLFLGGKTYPLYYAVGYDTLNYSSGYLVGLRDLYLDVCELLCNLDEDHWNQLEDWHGTVTRMLECIRDGYRQGKRMSVDGDLRFTHEDFVGFLGNGSSKVTLVGKGYEVCRYYGGVNDIFLAIGGLEFRHGMSHPLHLLNLSDEVNRLSASYAHMFGIMRLLSVDHELYSQHIDSVVGLLKASHILGGMLIEGKNQVVHLMMGVNASGIEECPF